jgi:hypothetical protein
LTESGREGRIRHGSVEVYDVEVEQHRTDFVDRDQESCNRSVEPNEREQAVLRFLRSQQVVVVLDVKEYYIDNAGKILGVLTHIVQNA